MQHTLWELHWIYLNFFAKPIRIKKTLEKVWLVMQTQLLKRISEQPCANFHWLELVCKLQNSKIKKKIITLIGPTACNKTSTAVHLTKKFPISIIGVDSVQIYKRFNIGSAKPTKEILEKYKHHLVDSADPENIFSVKNFYDQAYRIVKQAHSKNMIPKL